MRTKFTDTIKRKLEDINPKFVEQDWAKMRAFMDGQPPPTFWQQHGQNLFYAVSGLITTTLILTNLYQHIENKSLRSQIEKLSQKIESVDSRRPVNSPQPISDSPQSMSYGNSSVVSGSQAVVDSYKQIVSSNTKFGKEKNFIKSNPNSDREGNNSFEKTGFKTEGEGQNIVSNSVIYPELVKSNKSAAANTNFAPLSHIDTVFIASELPESELKVKKPVLVFIDKKPKAKLSLPQLPLSLGLSYDFREYTSAVGFWSEFQLNKKLRFGLGIEKATKTPERFVTDRNFNEKRKQDFREKHAAKLPPANEIVNITIDECRIEIPLSLTYILPYKNNYSFLFSTGTNLTLSSTEKIRFNMRKGPSEFEELESQGLSKPPLFSSLNLSVGVEKRTNKFVFQAVPYFIFANTPFTTNDRDEIRDKLGLRLRVLYNFGK